MILDKKGTQTLIQKILDSECPGVVLKIIDNDGMLRTGSELRFCGPVVKSVWVTSTTTVEGLGRECRVVIDEFISEARAMDSEKSGRIIDI